MRNVYSDDEIQQSRQICTIEKYYETCQKFIKICISRFSNFVSNMNQDEDQFDLDLRLFARKISRNWLQELQSKIDDVEKI